MLPSQLLANKENWTIGVYARDRNGREVRFSSETAFSFCINGACKRCGADRMKLLPIIKTRGFNNVIRFNDHPETTYEDVLSVLQEAGL